MTTNSSPDNFPYIIAVDNEPELLILLKLSLPRKGFNLDTSTTAAGLWDLIGKKLPDIIFLDINLNGDDGSKVCRSIKENKQTSVVPVILLSGNDDVENVAKNCGAAGFLTKPVSIGKILKEIQRVLL